MLHQGGYQAELLLVHILRLVNHQDCLGDTACINLIISDLLNSSLQDIIRLLQVANLPKKIKKKIIKKTDALSTAMKNVGKKPKKKTYTTLSQEIQVLTKMLREAGS